MLIEGGIYNEIEAKVFIMREQKRIISETVFRILSLMRIAKFELKSLFSDEFEGFGKLLKDINGIEEIVVFEELVKNNQYAESISKVDVSMVPDWSLNGLERIALYLSDIPDQKVFGIRDIDEKTVKERVEEMLEMKDYDSPRVQYGMIDSDYKEISEWLDHLFKDVVKDKEFSPKWFSKYFYDILKMNFMDVFNMMGALYSFNEGTFKKYYRKISDDTRRMIASVIEKMNVMDDETLLKVLNNDLDGMDFIMLDRDYNNDKINEYIGSVLNTKEAKEFFKKFDEMVKKDVWHDRYLTGLARRSANDPKKMEDELEAGKKIAERIQKIREKDSAGIEDVFGFTRSFDGSELPYVDEDENVAEYHDDKEEREVEAWNEKVKVYDKARDDKYDCCDCRKKKAVEVKREDENYDEFSKPFEEESKRLRDFVTDHVKTYAVGWEEEVIPKKNFKDDEVGCEENFKKVTNEPVIKRGEDFKHYHLFEITIPNDCWDDDYTKVEAYLDKDTHIVNIVLK